MSRAYLEVLTCPQRWALRSEAHEFSEPNKLYERLSRKREAIVFGSFEDQAIQFRS